MKAKKSLGQNFLKSELALNKIVMAGEIKKGDVILEIGPGRGALTEKLLASSCQLIAVEKDKNLYELLRIKFEKEISSGQLMLINEDILDFDLSCKPLAKSYKLIANIPYNITGAILKKFLTAKNQPALMVLMVQHEVAKRIVGNRPSAARAKAGKKESLLSISVKAYGEPKMIMKVSARYFSPSPKVDSAIISIKNISRKLFQNSPLEEYSPTWVGEGGGSIPPLLNKERGWGEVNYPPSPLSTKSTPQEGNLEQKFWEIVKAGFAHKRKKLSSNLKSLSSQGESLRGLENLGNKRAEDLTLPEWLKLVNLPG